jgi:LAO/AO transport system kinase
MKERTPSLDLLARLRSGDRAALSRLMSRAESGAVEARPTLAEVYRLAGRAHVIGVTGVPGSGKSTLVGKLVEALRRDARVGIIAVDPSSPYSGGAILGDRIRMSAVSGDDNVFIRSMATRGATGGMARAALDVVDLMDVAKYDIVIIETVGVGQDEVEIARASHTTVVVSAPGLGDEIQAIKAGILEIADIHVVSKADRSDANRTIADLKGMLALAAHAGPRPDWLPPVIGTSSYTGQGIDELISQIRRHRSVVGRERAAAIAAFRLQKTAEALLMERLARNSAAAREMYAVELAERRRDPYDAASKLLTAIFGEERP